MTKRDAFREHQSRAGKASAAKLTPEQRSERARKGAQAREAKRRERLGPAAFEGLHGDITLICSTCKERHYPRCK